MRPILPFGLIGLGTLVGCAVKSPATKSAQPSPEMAVQTTNRTVTIVGVPRYYVSGVPAGLRWGGIYGDTDGVDRLTADGVVLEVIRPKEYKGKMYGMHDDAHMADHYFLLGSRYELRVREEDIGRFGFGACTAVPFRRLNADEE